MKPDAGDGRGLCAGAGGREGGLGRGVQNRDFVYIGRAQYQLLDAPVHISDALVLIADVPPDVTNVFADGEVADR